MNKPKFDPKELLNSKRIFKSATPKGDISWYVKWISSFIIICAMSLRGIEGLQFIDLILSIFGVAGWLWVGMLWKDRALIILNAVGLFLLVKNLLLEFLI
mgnify:FL=1|tara:strand:+ start:42 stop:341 length:300 start_codon:yes stop_codon:yes gene_type:complete